MTERLTNDTRQMHAAVKKIVASRADRLAQELNLRRPVSTASQKGEVAMRDQERAQLSLHGDPSGLGTSVPISGLYELCGE